jgi:WD40 repeat protein
MDGTDINSIHISEELELIATADDFGQVRLLKYPTYSTRPKKAKYAGHCSHVTNVRFSYDGTRLFSAGGGDLTLFQWKIS